MRYITIPKPVLFEHLLLSPDARPKDKPDQKHPEVTFPSFVRTWAIMHPEVSKNHETLTKFATIEKLVKDMKEGDELGLEDELHEFLSNIARGLNFPSGEVKLALLPHVLAITGAAREPSVKAATRATEA